MANMRFILDNAVDRATLTASSTSGTLVASNLQKNEKSAKWRSTGTTATLTATWATAEIIDSVALGWTNLTALATVTVARFAQAEDTVPFDSFVFNSDTALPLGEFVWGVDPLVQGFSQTLGFSQQSQGWLENSAWVEKVTLTISDPDNAQGYLEVSRLSLGLRHEMEHNPKYDAKLSIVDRSKPTRAESGDSRIDSDGSHRALDISYEHLKSIDLNFLMRAANFGKAKGMFISVFPDSPDAKNQIYSFFAAPANNHESSYPFMDRWNNSLSLEEIA